MRIHSQEDLDDAIHLARNEPNNLVKLILVEMGDESAIASEVPSSLPRRSSGALKGHDIFAHQFAEEAEIRKRNGSRHSPPPGFLHTDRARSNSTASGRGEGE